MPAGRRTRLAELSAVHDEEESGAAAERRMLRFYAGAYPLVRDAMLRAGLDPASARAMRDIERKLAGFVDTPELRRADAQLATAEAAEREPALIGGEDPHQWLISRLDDIGRRYAASGTHPNLHFASFWELLGWATPPDDVRPAAGNAEQYT